MSFCFRTVGPRGIFPDSVYYTKLEEIRRDSSGSPKKKFSGLSQNVFAGARTNFRTTFVWKACGKWSENWCYVSKKKAHRLMYKDTARTGGSHNHATFYLRRQLRLASTRGSWVRLGRLGHWTLPVGLRDGSRRGRPSLLYSVLSNLRSGRGNAAYLIWRLPCSNHVTCWAFSAYRLR